MDDAPHIRIWICGFWQLPDGHHLTRTMKRKIATDPEDVERRSIAAYAFLAELRATGRDFPEGHGFLVEMLGMLTG